MCCRFKRLGNACVSIFSHTFETPDLSINKPDVSCLITASTKNAAPESPERHYYHEP